MTDNGNSSGNAATKTQVGNGHGGGTLTPQDFQRLFGEDMYRDVEVLKDGTVRERPRDGDTTDETVTRTLKTGRTWY